MCTVLLPPGVNPIAVNKYIISYIISYIIPYHIVYTISYHTISYLTLTRLNAFTTVTYEPTNLLLRNKSSAPLPPVGKSIIVNKYHTLSYHISNLAQPEINSVKSDMPLVCVREGRKLMDKFLQKLVHMPS